MPDLVVVGGGPVGLGAALYAARSGLSVVVLEPRVSPIDKACGEGIMPAGRAALADLDVAPSGHEFRGIRYVAPGANATADFLSGNGIGVRRTVLQGALADAVRAAGVEVCPLAAETISQDDGRVVVGTKAAGPTMSARYLLAADGLHSPTRRLLGLDARPVRLRRYGQRQHLRLAPWSPYVEVHWSRHGEAYVTPVGDDLVGVAILSASRVPFAELLSGFPTLAPLVSDAVAVGGVRGAGPLRQRSTRRTAGRCLLVGDASGYVDALTGEGISVGLAQAHAAVAAVLADRPELYERSWKRVTRRYAVGAHVLVQSTRLPVARRAIVPVAAALPGVFARIVNEIGRDPSSGRSRTSP